MDRESVLRVSSLFIISFVLLVSACNSLVSKRPSSFGHSSSFSSSSEGVYSTISDYKQDALTSCPPSQSVRESYTTAANPSDCLTTSLTQGSTTATTSVAITVSKGDVISTTVTMSQSTEIPKTTTLPITTTTIITTTKDQKIENNDCFIAGIENDVLLISVKVLEVDSIYKAYEYALLVDDSSYFNVSKIEIILPEGNLELTDTLTFDGIRHNNLPISIVGQKTEILGGSMLERGGWKSYSSNIYYKHIGYMDSISNLVIDGKQGTLARTDYLNGTYNDEKEMFTIKKVELNRMGITDLYGTFQVSTEEKWGQVIGNVSSITNSSISIYYLLYFDDYSKGAFFDSGRNYRSSTCACYLQNNLLFLDEEGEWYYDQSEGNLYYYPIDGTDINESAFLIPSLTTILDTKGMADGITFKGLTFSASSFSDYLVYGYRELQTTYNKNLRTNKNEHLPGMISIDSDYITFDSCTFKNSATNTIWVKEKTSDVSIINSRMLNQYGSGIYIGGTSPRYQDILLNVTIDNCIIDSYGRMFAGASGICATYVKDLDITNNTISNGRYSGITAGWGWTQNPVDSSHGYYNISYNKITNVMRSNLYDGAPIYVLGGFMNDMGEMFNTISYNYLEFSRGLGVIYLDEGSSSYYVHDNVLNIKGNEESHMLGAIFCHNPINSTKQYYTVCNSIKIERNYINIEGRFKTNTYDSNGETYTGEKLESYLKENHFFFENPIISNDTHIKEYIFYMSGSILNGRTINQEAFMEMLAIEVGNISLNESLIDLASSKKDSKVLINLSINHSESEKIAHITAFSRNSDSISSNIEIIHHKALNTLYLSMDSTKLEELKDICLKARDESGMEIGITISLISINLSNKEPGKTNYQNEGIFTSFNSIRKIFDSSSNLSINSYDQGSSSISVSIDGTFFFNDYLFDYMKRNGYTDLTFKIKPNEGSACTSIVMVDYRSETSYTYPKRFDIKEDGYITIRLSEIDRNFLDRYRLLFVLRDERGYSTGENQKIENGLMFDFIFT